MGVLLQRGMKVPAPARGAPWTGTDKIVVRLRPRKEIFRHELKKEARRIAGPVEIGMDWRQPLTNAPPLALHAASDDAIVKPLLLQAFMPLQEFPALLQALWPLQALVAMHLPWAASAGVDTVVTTVPARNSVAAAAASVAPDLEFNFMTFSSMLTTMNAVSLR